MAAFVSNCIAWYGNVGILQKHIFDAVAMTSSGPRLIIEVISAKTNAKIEFVRQVPQYDSDQPSIGNFVLIHSVPDLLDKSAVALVWKVPVQYVYESSQGIKVVVPSEGANKPTPCYQ